MRVLLAPALMLALLSGCVGECFDQPATAHFAFHYEGTGAELADEFSALGWTVVDAPNALSFDISREHNGTLYQGVVHYAGLSPAGNVSVVNVRGSLAGAGTTEDATAHLAPVVAPMAERFGAEAEYGRGDTHCGAV